MHGYDVALKLTLREVDVAIRELVGTTVAHWLNVELPEVRNTRVDLLGETHAGELLHIELQATNDTSMALRMAEYDGARLLESTHIGGNIIAILTRLPDPEAALYRVLDRISGLPPEERQAAFDRLAILAGLRKPLYEVIKEEAKRMPITLDIREHPLAVEEFARGLQEGELKVVRRQIQAKFGGLPEWAEERLKLLNVNELEDLGVRVLKAESIEALFQ